MARQRRGGFRPPELKGTLGTLINTALSQAGVVRDALERGAREGRSRLDEARNSRRRNDALAELGEVVLDLIRRGEIDLGELPEAQELVHHLNDLDDRGTGARVRRRGDTDTDTDDDADDGELDEIARAPSRSRFDDRDIARSRTTTTRATPRARTDTDDDGTVSSKAADRSRPVSSTRRPTTPQPNRVWRPKLDAGELATPAPPPPGREARKTLPNNPSRKGGIAFDDEDLADYMHPDDVPPKTPSDGDP